MSLIRWLCLSHTQGLVQGRVHKERSGHSSHHLDCGLLKAKSAGKPGACSCGRQGQLVLLACCGAGIRCTEALKEIMAQLEQLPGSGRTPDLTVSSPC